MNMIKKRTTAHGRCRLLESGFWVAERWARQRHPWQTMASGLLCLVECFIILSLVLPILAGKEYPPQQQEKQEILPSKPRYQDPLQAAFCVGIGTSGETVR